MDKKNRYRKRLNANPLRWVGFILETIGRVTYQGLFKLVGYCVHLLIQLTKLRLPQLKLKFPLIKAPPPVHISLHKLTSPKFVLPKFRLPKLKTIQYLLLSIVFTCLLIFYFSILKGLPRPNDLTNRLPSLSTRIYDRNGQLLFTFYKDQNRSLISLNDIPQHFKLATLAIEDSQFYQHNGFSWKGIIRSINQIIFNQQLQGGSTITQQLIKNALLTPERTMIRKIKELILAVEVELLFSKDEILEMYFNEVSYGGTAYGAEQAAQTYFGKSIKDVNLSEAALLAGLPAAPTTYSPFGSNPYLAIHRQHQVLNRMVVEHYIAPLEAQLAKQQKIDLAPQHTNIKAPHFVMYVKKILAQQYGETMVEQGGLQVTTSLDLDLQQNVQSIVTEEINKLFPLNISNGAALVTNPKSGEVLAMVGSRDYFDVERDGQVNVTTQIRQPGSAIKPVNYAVALENGFTAASIIQDTPVTYNIPGSQPYSPINYDRRFHGPVTLRSALANSYNVPAVKVLASYGVDKMLEMGEKMGITTWTQPSRYGLSLTLGGAEVKIIDIAVVFGTLANQGLRVDLHPILEVKDANNKILLDFECEDINTIVLSEPIEAASQHLSCTPSPVISPNTAYILTDILSDPWARAPAFGTRSFLNIPGHQVAVKTGTTNDKRDNWTIGYTNDYLAAVWVGNNDNSPMSAVASGITGASPIWNQIMIKLLDNQSASEFTPPKDLKQIPICTITGQLSCEGCPTKMEYFFPGTEPTSHCSPEQIKSILEQKKKEKEERDQILTGISTEQ